MRGHEQMFQAHSPPSVDSKTDCKGTPDAPSMISSRSRLALSENRLCDASSGPTSDSRRDRGSSR
jgi:hypothetical protein